jgi:hypothetical protein
MLKSKRFFFEKKKQKTFDFFGCGVRGLLVARIALGRCGFGQPGS